MEECPPNRLRKYEGMLGVRGGRKRNSLGRCVTVGYETGARQFLCAIVKVPESLRKAIQYTQRRRVVRRGK